MSTKSDIQTDSPKKVTVDSELITALWCVGRAFVGAEAALEIRTAFVADGSLVKITCFYDDGKKIGEMEAKIRANCLKTGFLIPEKVKAGKNIFFKAQLPKHSLVKESNSIPLSPAILIKEMKWSAKDVVRRGDELTLSTDFESDIPDGVECKFMVYDDRDGSHDLITCIYSEVKSKKVQAKWKLEKYDTHAIPTDKELKEKDKTRSYKAPTFFFMIMIEGILFGKNKESKLLKFLDWIRFYVRDFKKGCVSKGVYKLFRADGQEVKGTLDDFGTGCVKDAPPGPYTLTVNGIRELRVEKSPESSFPSASSGFEYFFWQVADFYDKFSVEFKEIWKEFLGDDTFTHEEFEELFTKYQRVEITKFCDASPENKLIPPYLFLGDPGLNNINFGTDKNILGIGKNEKVKLTNSISCKPIFLAEKDTPDNVAVYLTEDKKSVPMVTRITLLDDLKENGFNGKKYIPFNGKIEQVKNVLNSSAKKCIPILDVYNNTEAKLVEISDDNLESLVDPHNKLTAVRRLLIAGHILTFGKTWKTPDDPKKIGKEPVMGKARAKNCGHWVHCTGIYAGINPERTPSANFGQESIPLTSEVHARMNTKYAQPYELIFTNYGYNDKKRPSQLDGAVYNFITKDFESKWKTKSTLDPGKKYIPLMDVEGQYVDYESTTYEGDGEPSGYAYKKTKITNPFQTDYATMKSLLCELAQPIWGRHRVAWYHILNHLAKGINYYNETPPDYRILEKDLHSNFVLKDRKEFTYYWSDIIVTTILKKFPNLFASDSTIKMWAEALFDAQKNTMNEAIYNYYKSNPNLLDHGTAGLLTKGNLNYNDILRLNRKILEYEKNIKKAEPVLTPIANYSAPDNRPELRRKDIENFDLGKLKAGDWLYVYNGNKSGHHSVLFIGWTKAPADPDGNGVAKIFNQENNSPDKDDEGGGVYRDNCIIRKKNQPEVKDSYEGVALPVTVVFSFSPSARPAVSTDELLSFKITEAVTANDKWLTGLNKSYTDIHGSLLAIAEKTIKIMEDKIVPFHPHDSYPEKDHMKKHFYNPFQINTFKQILVENTDIKGVDENVMKNKTAMLVALTQRVAMLGIPDGIFSSDKFTKNILGSSFFKDAGSAIKDLNSALENITKPKPKTKT